MRPSATAGRRAVSLVCALVVLPALLLAHGCSSDGLRLGRGDAVNLNQLWGLIAQEEGFLSQDAIIVGLDMTLVPVERNAAGSGQSAHLKGLYFVAWASGPVVDVTVGWPTAGHSEISVKTAGPPHDPSPPLAGYSLSSVFSSLDYVGLSGLLDQLQQHTGKTSLRLRLVYPPTEVQQGPRSTVPLLVLGGGVIEAGTGMDASQLARDSAPFEVLPTTTNDVLAILWVPAE